jgi:hypothetical protein
MSTGSRSAYEDGFQHVLAQHNAVADAATSSAVSLLERCRIFGGNPHVVLTGDVSATVALHTRTTAEAWRPADRSWFVCTSDGFDTHLGGLAAAIGALIDDNRVEVLPIAADDPVDISPEWGRPD